MFNEIQMALIKEIAQTAQKQGVIPLENLDLFVDDIGNVDDEMSDKHGVASAVIRAMETTEMDDEHGVDHWLSEIMDYCHELSQSFEIARRTIEAVRTAHEGD